MRTTDALLARLLLRRGGVPSQDCAPLETVVTLLGQQSIVYKVFKPVAEVTPEEVIGGLQQALIGAPQRQHMNEAPAPSPEAG